MAFAVYNKFIVDQEGAPILAANIKVHREDTGALAILYADPAGSPKSNDFLTGADGLVSFYAAGLPEGYKITATHPDLQGGQAVFRHEQIGEAKGFDVGDDGANKLLTRDQLDQRYNASVLNNTSAITDPTVSNDDSQGYSFGSVWYNTATSEAFKCFDATVGAAVWQTTTLDLGDLGSIVTYNQGVAAGEVRVNSENEAEFSAIDYDIIELAGTAITLTGAHNGKLLRLTSDLPITITVPEQITEAIQNGFQCVILRAGDGLVTVIAEGADVIESAGDLVTLEVKFAAASIIKQAVGLWLLFGGLKFEDILDPVVVKTAYEVNPDTNAFTDADQTKLAGISAGATIDQTGAQIKSAYESEADTNAYTDAEKLKLNGIAAGATIDQTGAQIKSAYEAEPNTNGYTDAEKLKLADLESSKFLGEFISLAALQLAFPAPSTGAYANVDTGPGSNVERYVWDTDDAAYVLQLGVSTLLTNAQIKTQYEANPDTNAFTDASQTKLAGIAAGATVDQTGAQIKSAYEAEADTNAYTDAEKLKLATNLAFFSTSGGLLQTNSSSEVTLVSHNFPGLAVGTYEIKLCSTSSHGAMNTSGILNPKVVRPIPADVIIDMLSMRFEPKDTNNEVHTTFCGLFKVTGSVNNNVTLNIDARTTDTDDTFEVLNHTVIVTQISKGV